MIEASAADPYCGARQHNRILPELTDPANLPRWQRIEEGCTHVVQLSGISRRKRTLSETLRQSLKPSGGTPTVHS
jgi:hypothetical protein